MSTCSLRIWTGGWNNGASGTNWIGPVCCAGFHIDEASVAPRLYQREWRERERGCVRAEEGASSKKWINTIYQVEDSKIKIYYSGKTGAALDDLQRWWTLDKKMSTSLWWQPRRVYMMQFIEAHCECPLLLILNNSTHYLYINIYINGVLLYK